VSGAESVATGGGLFALVSIVALFVRAMLRQDFGAWKLVAAHEQTIIRLEEDLEELRSELRAVRRELDDWRAGRRP
jgi:hypothetical protein